MQVPVSAFQLRYRDQSCTSELLWPVRDDQVPKFCSDSRQIGSERGWSVRLDEASIAVAYVIGRI
jgi:hypothetical protein